MKPTERHQHTSICAAPAATKTFVTARWKTKKQTKVHKMETASVLSENTALLFSPMNEAERLISLEPGSSMRSKRKWETAFHSRCDFSSRLWHVRQRWTAVHCQHLCSVHRGTCLVKSKEPGSLSSSPKGWHSGVEGAQLLSSSQD